MEDDDETEYEGEGGHPGVSLAERIARKLEISEDPPPGFESRRMTISLLVKRRVSPVRIER